MSTLLTLAVKMVLDKAQYDKDVESAGSKLKSTGESMQKAGGVMTAGVTLPLLGLGMVAFNAASDLSESMSKVDVVFEDSAQRVKDFAETADTSLGMSEEAALAAAGTYGNLFTAMGMGEDSAADMSIGLVGLASDLASFNNMDPTEVLDKLRAGLSGETEPLKSLGVNLNAAAVEAKAMELGLVGVDGELSASAKAQATYALVMEQTTKAQGDFARTSEGAANQTRIAKAQMADISATLGEKLLPIGLKVLTMVNGLLERFTNLSPQTQNVIMVVLGLAAAAGPLLSVVGTLLTVLPALSGALGAVAGVMTFPLIAVIALVVAAIVGLYLAWTNNWGGIQDKVQAVIEWISPYIEKAFAFWRTIFDAFALAFSGDWEGFGAKLREAWNMLWENIKGIVTGAWDWLRNLDWGQIGLNIVQGIANGITNAVDWIIRAVQGVGGAAVAAIKGFLGIASESKVFKNEVGREMARGMVGGWNEELTGMNMPAMTRMVSVRPVAVNFTYAPMMSLTDQYEAENVLKPFIQQGVREALAGV